MVSKLFKRECSMQPSATVSASTIRSTRLRELYAYWRSKAENRKIPARADIDPSEIPGLLPYLCLIDVIGNPAAFRYRLVGTKVVDLRGKDVTGRWVDNDLYPKNLRDVAAMMSSALEARAPVVGHNRFWAPGRIWRKVEWLNLPLSTDGEWIDMLLMGFVEMDASGDASEQFTGASLEVEVETINQLA